MMSVLLKIWENKDGCSSDGSQIQSQLLGLFCGVLLSFLCDFYFLWCMAVNTKSTLQSLNASCSLWPMGFLQEQITGSCRKCPYSHPN